MGRLELAQVQDRRTDQLETDRSAAAGVTMNVSADPDAIPCWHDRKGGAGEATLDQRERIDRARRGDHAAFAELVDGSLRRLDAAARLILRDPDLAQDAVQDALIRAWRDLPGLREPDRFDAWLHRLTVNACLDLLRRRRRRPIEVELSPIVARHPQDHASAFDQRELLDAALRRLEPGHRAVVALHYLLGMPLPEVATALGIPYGTAKSRLHYALATMRAGATAEPGQTTAALSGGQLA
jgi:RNA polymerase sigma-70 factor (ECF subfamily)